MKKKALALAVAGAFFAPASYAAQDSSGMQYTSAAEGFYGSLRAQFRTEETNNGGAGLLSGTGGSFGIRGSNDLGNGLGGFYQFEATFDNNEDSALQTKIAHVGLEGAFGRIWAGTGSTETYNMVYGATDIGNTGGGNFVGNPDHPMRPVRDNNMIQYRTPDISGFQGAVGIKLQAGQDNGHTAANGNPPGDDNNVDMWSAAAKYSVRGFTGAFAYSVRPDTAKWDNTDPANPMADGTEDATAWTARLSYEQENWHIHAWYGRNNTTDIGTATPVNAALRNAGRVIEDARLASIAASVSVGAVDLYGLVEAGHDGSDNAQVFSLAGIQYNLGSQSRVWINYVGTNFDVNQNDNKDYVVVGLRHDF